MEKNMSNIKKLKELILELPEIKSAKHIKSVESAVTTAWSEEIWNHDMIARDTLQNMYDGCIESKLEIEQIKINTDNDQIRVYAPNEYNLEKLYYIGSSKSEKEYRQIGAHGEGIKKCFSDLARMGIFHPILISSNKALIVSVGKEISGTDSLRPLVYNYFQINKLKGNYFILNTIDKKLKKAYEFGLKNFFYKKNPLIGEVLHSHNDITIYKSNDKKNGYGFYKGLKRIDIKDIPIIISIDKSYAALDKKVKIDRDRKAFDSKLQSTFYSIFSRSGFYYHDLKNNPAIKYILKSSKEIWPKGHLLLSAIASNSYGRLKDDKSLKELFGKDYYAESRWTYSRDISYNDWFSTKTQNWVRSKTEKEKKKKKILPSYFTSFGVMSALENFIRNKKNAESRIKNKKTKDLTPKEQKVINFCFDAAKSISPTFAKLFAGDEYEDPIYETKFKTITCNLLLGELRDSGVNSKIIYLNKSLFKESFGKFFSVWLHELSHSFAGSDGDRSFSDCLTVLIQKCIDNNASVKKYSNQWSKILN